jgi:7-cyano-7-deazaguanine synthase
MLITLAAMTYAADPLAELLVGTVVGDDAHPDGRREFVSAVDSLLRQQSGVRVSAPAIDMTTLQLVRKAAVPMSLLGWTFSCHTGEWACGSCRGCNKHRQVIECLEEGAEARPTPHPGPPAAAGMPRRVPLTKR